MNKEIHSSFTWINDRHIPNEPCKNKDNYVIKILSNAMVCSIFNILEIKSYILKRNMKRNIHNES